MTLWNIHLASRDERGTPRREFLGAFAPAQLAAALVEAMRRAAERSAGVQISRQRTPLGSVEVARGA
jgi:hypothetical protein